MRDLGALLQQTVATGGSMVVMLSLNFLLLAFFILLNSMATRESTHAHEVLARVREGYDTQGPVLDRTGSAPWVPKDRWEQDLAGRVQGVVLNRLQLDTVPMEVDGKRLVVRLPVAALFDARGRLSQPELVRNLMGAGGEGATVAWQVGGDLGQDARLAAQAATLMALTGKVAMAQGEPEVRVVFTPGEETKPSVGRTLQRLSVEAGAHEVRGEGDGRP